ncbi:2Fe-2S iron-sulfur cluster-binding protein [Acinetobacter baumannii]|uniref:2Fe-2S iron-sulfur cluster-binding protein n=1 Tax=Acinetobacter baumannii TaxID=470 RepID=UPI002148999E|nr:2Fe-2S iron-sulfur cluster-binding protein [Acinetobacter baumannii]MCR0099575.1 2Fe-2S iron-sulfur cluster-binding protein [Acinetobacter baumannii]
MSQITFIAHDGAQTSVAIEAGKSLMQLAVENGVAGIDGDCGGECACGTCHVIVSAEWSDVAGTAQANEQQMLEMTPERAATLTFGVLYPSDRCNGWHDGTSA